MAETQNKAQAMDTSSKTVEELIMTANAAAIAESAVSNAAGPIPLSSIQLNHMQFTTPPPTVKIIPGVPTAMPFPQAAGASQGMQIPVTTGDST